MVGLGGLQSERKWLYFFFKLLHFPIITQPRNVDLKSTALWNDASGVGSVRCWGCRTVRPTNRQCVFFFFVVLVLCMCVFWGHEARLTSSGRQQGSVFFFFFIGLYFSFALCFYSPRHHYNLEPRPNHKGLMLFSMKPPIKVLWQARNSWTNVQDIKVSNDGVHVGWVKTLGPEEMLCSCLRPSACLRVHMHPAACVRAACNRVAQCNVSSLCQSKLVELHCAEPALPGPHQLFPTDGSNHLLRCPVLPANSSSILT